MPFNDATAQPCRGRAGEPRSGPLTAVGERPLATVGKGPLAAVGERPLATVGEGPLATVGERPLTAIERERRHGGAPFAASGGPNFSTRLRPPKTTTCAESSRGPAEKGIRAQLRTRSATKAVPLVRKTDPTR